MRITALVADHHEVFRKGVCSILNAQFGIEVLAEAEDGMSVLQLNKELAPDLILMDTSIPRLDGIETTRRLVSQQEAGRVLLFSGSPDKRLVIEAFEAGAKGYLAKDCCCDELVGAVRAIAAGESYLHPKVAGAIVRDYIGKTPGTASPALSALSERELEVLKRLVNGESMKEIAFSLTVSVKTVESRRQQIMKKLDLWSVASLTKFAVREGLTSLEI